MDTETLDKIISNYLSRGFGSMNKNDFEVWIFNQLLNNNDNCKNKSDFYISQYLRIPIAKVKRLRYEAEIKYGKSNEEELRRQLIECLRHSKYRGTDKEWKIMFAVPNQMLRQKLSDILQQDGRFFDSSFNSNIVQLVDDDFCFLLDNVLLSDKEKKEIKRLAKRSISEVEHRDVKDILKSLGLGLGKTIAEKFVGDVATDSLIQFIKQLIQNNKENNGLIQ